MAMFRTLSTIVLAVASCAVLAAAPSVNSPLPPLKITERGELIMSGEDFSFVPWSSDNAPQDKVHVIQYFGATLSDRDVFKPFTDRLQTDVEPGTVHVSTILNLDAALWGTTGFVISELEKNKKMHPQASMVLDDDGSGISEWELGKAGTGLMVMDKKGIVKYFTRQPLSEEELTSTLELIRSLSAS